MRTTKAWLPIMMTATLNAGCDEPTGGRSIGAELLDDGESGRAGGVGNCSALGYVGKCIGDVSLWTENNACWVRDCESENKTCGWISNAVGYGCLQGPQGSTAFDCKGVGYEGACLSDEVLVWSENNTCKYADCAALGKTCGWTDSVGYDCVAESGGDDGGGGGGGGGGGSNGLLSITQMLGGASWGVSQYYGPTNFNGGYGYCQSYGNWGGQLVHCGVDITVPYGTPMFIPGNATVLVSGETPYYEDAINPAAGELKLRMAHDGAHVILGHMTQINVWTGQNVTAGQSAGKSGTMNGPHVHLEVRVPDAAFASGFRTVDPFQYFAH